MSGRLVRAPEEYPTPAFRLVIACATAVVGIAPAYALIGADVWLAPPVAAAVVSIPIVAARGSTPKRLSTAAATAFASLVVVDAIAFALAFVTAPWE